MKKLLYALLILIIDTILAILFCIWMYDLILPPL